MKNVPAEAFRRQFFTLLPVYINVFMMGCTTGWMTYAVYFFQNDEQVFATPFECTLIVSCCELGRLVFAIPGGILVDKFGRRTIINSAGILYFLSWLILSLNSSVITICIVRFIQGVSTALVNATSLISIGEIASPEVRGKLTGIYQTFLTFGLILECGIAILFSSYYILTYSTAVLSSLYFISMYWLMETPNYLISTSKLQQAEINLKRIRPGYAENDIKAEYEKLQKYIEKEKHFKEETNWLQFLKSNAIRKPLITVILLNFFTLANGRYMIGIYITVMYPNVRLVPVQYYPLIAMLIKFSVSICAVFYIEKYPRRSIYMIGSSLYCVVMAFCAFANYWWIQHENTVFKWLFLLSIMTTDVIHASSLQPMCSALKSEILPQAVKGFGGSLGVIAQAVANTIMFQLYYFINENFASYYLYLIFSINSLILCVLVYLRLPEGRGKMLADLQMDFNKDEMENFKNTNNNETK